MDKKLNRMKELIEIDSLETLSPNLYKASQILPKLLEYNTEFENEKQDK